MKHLAKIALVALGCVAAYWVYEFTRLVAGTYIAYIAAASLVLTYVGLGYADIPHEMRKRAAWVARAAMGVEALYGVHYVLHIQSPSWFAAPLHPALSVWLALLHGAAFSVLAYFLSIFVTEQQSAATAVHARPADYPPPIERRLMRKVCARCGARHYTPSEYRHCKGPNYPAVRQTDVAAADQE